MKKCPKCELNFITDNQDVCNVCKPKVQSTQKRTIRHKVAAPKIKRFNHSIDYTSEYFNRNSGVNTWKEEVVYLLRNLGGKAYLSEIYKEFETHGTKPYINSYAASIRDALEKGSRESVKFDGEELFYMVDGKNNGHYGLIEMKDKFDI